MLAPLLRLSKEEREIVQRVDKTFDPQVSA